MEKVEDRHTRSGHIHLFLVVVRNGAQGWPGICQACRIPAPNIFPASKSSFGPSFYPLCVQRGKKLLFVDSCVVLPYLQKKKMLDPYQFFMEIRQEGSEFCILVGLKGQQYDAF